METNILNPAPAPDIEGRTPLENRAHSEHEALLYTPYPGGNVRCHKKLK
jgi:hypothetical protein